MTWLVSKKTWTFTSVPILILMPTVGIFLRLRLRYRRNILPTLLWTTHSYLLETRNAEGHLWQASGTRQIALLAFDLRQFWATKAGSRACKQTELYQMASTKKQFLSYIFAWHESIPDDSEALSFGRSSPCHIVAAGLSSRAGSRTFSMQRLYSVQEYSYTIFFHGRCVVTLFVVGCLPVQVPNFNLKI